MAKRTRPHVITLRVNDAELALIEERMQQAGIMNREAYLRRAAINCYCSTAGTFRETGKVVKYEGKGGAGKWWQRCC